VKFFLQQHGVQAFHVAFDLDDEKIETQSPEPMFRGVIEDCPLEASTGGTSTWMKEL